MNLSINSIIKFILIIYVIKLCNSEITFRDKIHKVQESGKNCVLKIAADFFQFGSIICVISSGLKNSTTNTNTAITTEALILNSLMRKNDWTLMMKNGREYKKKLQEENKKVQSEKVHNYIIFVKTYADLNVILIYLKRTASWNPHANFILYVEVAIDDVLEKEMLLKSFIELAWKYLVINLTLLVPDAVAYIHRVMTWFPFDHGNCGTQDVKFIELGICNNSKLIPEIEIYFPEKVPRNLNNCPVKIGTIVWPPFILPPESKIYNEKYIKFNKGVEIQIMQTIAKKSNFSAKYRSFEIPENWGTILSKANGTGLMGLLLRKEVDIGLGTITPTLDIHNIFDFSIQYMQDKTTWIVPVAAELPKWQGLITIFQLSTWISSFIVYIIVSFVTYLLGRNVDKTEEYSKFRSIYGTLLLTLCMLVGNGVTTFPKTTKLKCFIYLWSLFCMHWYTAYTTSLISMLTSTIESNHISTIKELLDSGMEFGMTLPTTRYFKTESLASDNLGYLILEKQKTCLDAPVCLDRIARKKDFAMALSRQYFKFVANNYKDPLGRQLLKPFDHDIVTAPVEMILIKGYPLLPRIDMLLLRIVEAGLIDYWSTKVIEESTMEKQNKMDYETITSTSDKKVLTTHHLEGAFIVLAMGYIFATISFVLEYLYSKVHM